MSLLLQALQKASKSREGADGESSAGTGDAGDPLSLEPLSEPELRNEDITAHAGPTPAQAAAVLRASEPPAYSALDWARDHQMLVLIAAAVLFAIGYGTYVYIQVSNPGMFRSPPPPASAPAQASAPPPPAQQVETAQAPVESKISGMPSIEGASGPESGRTAPASAPQSVAQPPSEPARRTAPARTSTPARASGASAPAPETRSAPVRATASTRATSTAHAAPTAVADDEVETVEIAPSQEIAALTAPGPQPGSDIAVRRDPGGLQPVSPTLMAAYQALEAGDYPRAKMLYNEVLRTEPRNVDALLGLGAIAWKEGRADDASGFYGRVLQADPRNAHAQAGLIALVGGADPVAAESRLKQLISRDPAAFLYFTLGNLYAEQGQWPAAQHAYFQAVQLQPDNPDYAFNLAVGLEHLGQPRLALDYYRRALELSFQKGRANFDQNLAIQRVGQLSARVQ